MWQSVKLWGVMDSQQKWDATGSSPTSLEYTQPELWHHPSISQTLCWCTVKRLASKDYKEDWDSSHNTTRVQIREFNKSTDMSHLEADLPRKSQSKERKKERQSRAWARLTQQERSKHTHTHYTSHMHTHKQTNTDTYTHRQTHELINMWNKIK